MALKNLTVQESLILGGIVVLLVVGALVRHWRGSREDATIPPSTQPGPL